MNNLDLSIDRHWLYFQILVLVAIPIRELLKSSRDRNLFAIFVPITMLVLVQGQTWWVFNQFQQHGVTNLRHLNQNISLIGARLSNLYLGVWVIAFCISFFLINLRQPSSPRNTSHSFVVHNRELPKKAYLIITILIFLAGYLFVIKAGGLSAIIGKPGYGVAGGTFLALFVGLGKYPFMQKLAWGKKIKLYDWGLFALALSFMLFNSRFLTAFMLFQAIILCNYCRSRIFRKHWAWVASALMVIFIIFGLYRDYGWRAEGKLSWQGVRKYAASYESNDALLNWFYSMNVEGFAGLAGLVTYEQSQGHIDHDWGLSNLRITTQVLPNKIRNDSDLPFVSVTEYLTSLYPFNGSVVPSGVQDAYAHAGILGLVIFGIILGWLVNWVHLHMLNCKYDRLKIGVLSVYSMHLIRGNFVAVIFFALFEFAILLFYRAIIALAKYDLLIHIKKRKIISVKV